MSRNLMVLPDCLPEDEGGLEAVLVKIEEYLENPGALLNLVREDDANRTRIEELAAKLTDDQPPYATGLSEEEWDGLLEMVCPYLRPEEEPVVIEGLGRNADLVSINEMTNSFKPNPGRLEITYTVIDTLNLAHTKLEIYKLSEKDTTMATFYTDLSKGEKIEFTDS